MMRRFALITVGLAGLSFAYLRGAPDAPSNRPGRVSRFNKSDRSVLAEVRADGTSSVVLDVASRAGENPKVAAKLARIGAIIRYREDAIDYLSAIVPLDRADEASRLAEIDLVSVDMVFFRTLDPTQDTGSPTTATTIRRPKFAAPGPATARENAFLPTRDMGAPQFVRAHPTFDGRGITIGMVDAGVEVLVPELQEATTLNGRPTRKIVDWLFGTDPLDNLLPLTHPGTIFAALGAPFVDSLWIDMRHETRAGDDKIVAYEGLTYRVPSQGQYRIGLFDERKPGSRLMASAPAPYYLRGDVNLDGNPPDSSGVFAVLWNETTKDVWVDTNQNHSFVDERPMTDYAVRFDVGTFGEDDPSTPLRETVPFVVQTDSKAKFVGLGITRGPHGTMVAATAAGRGFFHGAFDGVAPGAQIVSVLSSGNVYDHNVVEALIRTAQHRAVDVMSLTVASASAVNGESFLLDVIVNRLVERYGKPVVVAAGNLGPGMGSILHGAAATKAIGVGAYIGKDTWLANLGARIANDDSIATFSVRGPRGDGALKPDILAPTDGVAPTSPSFEGDNRIGHYVMPAGYRVGGGTSQATPMVAGAIALLLSAARQEGIATDPERVKLALVNGARYLSGYHAHEQGNGLLQVAAAWDALRMMREKAPAIIADAPVRTPVSAEFAPPHRGPGLYERDGWSAGQRGTRTIVLTRTSGSNMPVSYDLRWLGNDGTLESPARVTLPLTSPVDVPVTIAPRTAGAHSAILQIVDRASALVIHQVLVTIIAAEAFESSQGYTVSRSGRAPRPGAVSHFFRVPEDVPVFSVAVRIQSGTLKVSVLDAASRNVDSYVSNNTIGYQPAGAQWNRAFERPQPGVWEVVIENSQDAERLDRSFPSPLPPADYTVTARLLGVDVTMAPISRHTDDERVVDVLAVNRHGSFNGALKGSVLGTTRSQSLALTRDAPQRVFEITVPPGTERLAATINGDPTADLDLYLFDCTGKRCALRAHGTAAGSREHVSVYTPTAGTWKIVVDAFALPAGTTRVEYRDWLLHPLYGRLDVTDGRTNHAFKDSWRATAVARVSARPDDGRTLVGFVDVLAEGVEDVERTPRGIIKWPTSLGGILIDLDAQIGR